MTFVGLMLLFSSKFILWVKIAYGILYKTTYWSEVVAVHEQNWCNDWRTRSALFWFYTLLKCHIHCSFSSACTVLAFLVHYLKQVHKKCPVKKLVYSNTLEKLWFYFSIFLHQALFLSCKSSCVLREKIRVPAVQNWSWTASSVVFCSALLLT